MMKERDIISFGNLTRDIVTDFRGFESRFAVKIISIRNWYKNTSIVEQHLEFLAKKLMNILTEVYIDDNENTDYYPLIVEDHMFFLKTNKKISNYSSFILESLVSSKKGCEVSTKKLSNQAFVEKAPKEIIDLETKKLEDFGYKWKLWSEAFLRFEE